MSQLEDDLTKRKSTGPLGSEDQATFIAHPLMANRFCPMNTRSGAKTQKERYKTARYSLNPLQLGPIFIPSFIVRMLSASIGLNCLSLEPTPTPSGQGVHLSSGLEIQPLLEL